MGERHKAEAGKEKMITIKKRIKRCERRGGGEKWERQRKVTRTRTRRDITK